MKGNWRRIFCGIWGHEYIGCTHFYYGYPQWVCLRCLVEIRLPPAEEWRK